MYLFFEAEVLTVEGECGVDVVDDVADADGGHGQASCSVTLATRKHPIVAALDSPSVARRQDHLSLLLQDCGFRSVRRVSRLGCPGNWRGGRRSGEHHPRPARQELVSRIRREDTATVDRLDQLFARSQREIEAHTDELADTETGRCGPLRAAVLPLRKHRQPADGLPVAGVGVVVSHAVGHTLMSDAQCSHGGTPWDSSSVATKLRFCRSRSACTSTSSVGPSTPWFHERLWLSPSALSSPLASLFLSL